MSNRLTLSATRNVLHDLQSDLRGIEQQVISISAAGNVARAVAALEEAKGFLTDALAERVDITPAASMGAIR